MKKVVCATFIVYNFAVLSMEIPDECRLDNCSELSEVVSCRSSCIYDNKEQICNATLVGFGKCENPRKTVPLKITNPLSVAEFFADFYSSVVRPIAVDCLVRHGTIRENAALDKIRQSTIQRVLGYAGSIAVNICSTPISFLNYVSAMTRGTSSTVMSAVPITVSTVQLLCDVYKTAKWFWHRRSPLARYSMYAGHIESLDDLRNLSNEDTVVVNVEKRRVYLKMLKIWGNNADVRNDYHLEGKLQNMHDAGVRLADLNEEDQRLVIQGLDTELGNQRGREALQDIGLL